MPSIQIKCGKCGENFVVKVSDELKEMYDRVKSGYGTTYDDWNFVPQILRESKTLNKYELLRSDWCYDCYEKYYFPVYGYVPMKGFKRKK